MRLCWEEAEPTRPMASPLIYPATPTSSGGHHQPISPRPQARCRRQTPAAQHSRARMAELHGVRLTVGFLAVMRGSGNCCLIPWTRRLCTPSPAADSSRARMAGIVGDPWHLFFLLTLLLIQQTIPRYTRHSPAYFSLAVSIRAPTAEGRGLRPTLDSPLTLHSAF